MSPSAPRPPSPHPPTSEAATITYYSAYRGSVYASDGSFDHFLRYVDPVHETNGYWRFQSTEDERRAFAYGLSTPEMVLMAADRGDGLFDDITLRWLPGNLDTGNKPSVGTAAAHLESIYNERKVLGKSLSFRGFVPTYPITTEFMDPTLLNYRLLKYGLQKGNPEVVNIVETYKQRTQSQRKAMPFTEKQNEHESNTQQSDDQLSFSVLQDDSPDISALPDTGAYRDLSVPLDPALFGPPSAHKVPSREPRPSEQKRQNGHSRTDSNKSCTSRVTSQSSSNTHPVSSQNTAYTIAESSEQENEFMEFSKVNNLIPCIDCDEIGRHSRGCNIGSIKPLEDLTASDYQQLVDAVERFDPRPWTTHAGPPKQPETPDVAMQTKSMAQTIRLLDSYKDSVELHALPDEAMIFMWALKITPGVEIIQG